MPTAARIPSDAKHQRSATQVIESPEFKRLVVKRWSVSLILLALLFGMYYGYILLIPYAPDLMRTRLGATVTVAIPLGIGVIAVAFILTAVYVGWANEKYDPEVDRLKSQLRK
jgi:uncharacterized membrane protein (DUF485 family)